MFIALREVWRSKLKFGLLAAATALLVFLLLFLSTISSTLLGSLTGAIENAEADVLVFSEDSSRNVQASRFEAGAVDWVEVIPGVDTAAGMSEATLTVEIDGARQDLSLWGTVPGQPGDVPVVEGRAAWPGEVVMDASAKDEGFVLGSTITLIETGRTLEVVGFTEDRIYSGLPTGYTPSVEWNRIFFDTFPGAPEAPIAIIATDVQVGADPAVVSADISRFLAASDAATPAEAAASAPGVDAITTSFNLIVGITFGIVIVVIGFFFTILAVQKRKSYALLRAVGASRPSLAGSIVLQIVMTVALGSILAIGFLNLISGSLSFSLDVEPAEVLVTSAILLIASVLAGGFAIRRALRVDPVSAAQGAG